MKALLKWIFAKNSLPFWTFLALALWAPKWAVRFTQKVEKLLKALALRRRAVIAGIGLFHLLVQFVLSVFFYWPQPRVHDEYSYLLAADTFASGRLTNPTPPSKENFESFHILLSPTYMSKYPPGQGLALAIGQILTGAPIVGAWLTMALAVAACTWALYAWLAPLWALMGGLIIAVHPVFFEWGQSFWGGGVAMLGGALVFGAVGKLREKYSRIPVVLFALGTGILANSRPYEGLVMVVISCVLYWRLRKKKTLKPAQKAQSALILTGIGAVFVAGMLVYNKQVTGSMWKLPYTQHAEQYSIAPNFLWQSPRPMHSFSRQDLDFHYAGFEQWQYSNQLRSVWNFFFWVNEKLSIWLQETFRLKFVLIGILGLFAGRWTSSLGWLFGSLVFFVLMMLQGTFFNLHYTAPAVALFSVLVMVGMERVSRWVWRGRPVGRILVVMSLLWTLIPSFAFYLQSYHTKKRHSLRRTTLDRIKLEQQVMQFGPRHMILLPCENLKCVVVANRADLPNAAVIWARELEPDQTKKLINYFPDRSLWRLVRKDKAYEVIPYSDAPEKKEKRS